MVVLTPGSPGVRATLSLQEARGRAAGLVTTVVLGRRRVGFLGFGLKCLPENEVGPGLTPLDRGNVTRPILSQIAITALDLSQNAIILLNGSPK